MIRDDLERRRKLSALRSEIKALEAPEREARKIAKAKGRAKREKALVRSEGQRAPRQRDPAYLAWLRRQPCVICGTRRKVEAAHVRAGYPDAGWAPTGMMQKPDDRRSVPLCSAHHREGPDAQHRASERAWWSNHGIDPPDLCRALYAAFEAGHNADAVLRRFTTIKQGATNVA